MPRLVERGLHGMVNEELDVMIVVEWLGIVCVRVGL